MGESPWERAGLDSEVGLPGKGLRVINMSALPEGTGRPGLAQRLAHSRYRINACPMVVDP